VLSGPVIGSVESVQLPLAAPASTEEGPERDSDTASTPGTARSRSTTAAGSAPSDGPPVSRLYAAPAGTEDRLPVTSPRRVAVRITAPAANTVATSTASPVSSSRRGLRRAPATAARVAGFTAPPGR
jgi:hypothetical protein